MAFYDVVCKECKKEQVVVSRISEMEENIAAARCEDCESPVRLAITSPGFTIGSAHTFDGKSKTVAGSGYSGKESFNVKEQSSVPINIIDEKPGGGYTVTRIGNKRDIEND